MTHHRLAPVLLALAAAASAPVAAQPATAAPAASAASAPAVTVRPPVGKALNEAIALHKDGKSADALARIDAGIAEVKDPTPVEAAYLARTRGLLLLQLDKPADGVAALEAAANGALPRADQLMVEEALTRALFNLKRYGASVTWARKAAAHGSAWSGLQNVLIRALYLNEDHAGAVAEIEALMKRDEKAVGAEELRVLASSYAKIKNEEGYARVLERLLREHPRPEYWPDLMARVQRQPGWQSRYEIDLLRLRLLLDQMNDEADYLDLADMAAKAGQPVEAQKVVDAGFAKGLLGSGKNAAEHQKLRAAYTRQANDDRQGLASAKAPAVSDARSAGLALSTGAALVAIGQADRGLEAMRAALAGPLTDPGQGRLQYAQALLSTGRRDEALDTLRGLAADPGVGMLSRLWVIALTQKKT